MEPKDRGLEDDLPFQLGEFLGSLMFHINFPGCIYVASLKLTEHLKMDGWNTIVSFWDGLFPRLC